MNIVLQLLLVLVVCFSQAPIVCAQGLIGKDLHIEQDPSVPLPPATPKGVLRNTVIPEYQTYINKILSESLLFRSKTPVVVSVNIDQNGMVRPSELYVDHSSGNLVADFACIDAILSGTPYKSPPAGTLAWNNTYSFFGNFLKDDVQVSTNIILPTASSDAFLTAVKAKHPIYQKNTLAMRLIPRSILKRYPGLFSPLEIDGLQNIAFLKKEVFDAGKGIPADYMFTKIVKDENLFEFYKEWADFQNQHKNPTKQDVLKEQMKLKLKYAGLFA